MQSWKRNRVSAKVQGLPMQSDAVKSTQPIDTEKERALRTNRNRRSTTMTSTLISTVRSTVLASARSPTVSSASFYKSCGLRPRFSESAEEHKEVARRQEKYDRKSEKESASTSSKQPAKHALEKIEKPLKQKPTAVGNGKHSFVVAGTYP